jgi:hypothetical protein
MKSAVDYGQIILGFNEHQTRGESTGVSDKELFTKIRGRTALKEAVNQDHRVQPALERETRRGSHPQIPPQFPLAGLGEPT